jgi:ribosomal protein L37AE/L43A
MELCPCCNALMLRHIRSRQLFWLCQSCSFEMVIRSKSEATKLEAPMLGRESKANVATSFA